jgi:deoxycytidine triphosphate deaminase
MMSYCERFLWADPLPESFRAGVLLADQIMFFVDAVHLIEPSTFSLDDLRPAAYDVHIGDTYYVDDQPKTLGPGDGFKIRANGLVYVKTKENFNIPYYMVARYSLRVTQVYRGLLIDNGLHIDPGYHGPIYVPIHNFTDQDRPLSEGQAFLSIEFARTTPLPIGPLARIHGELELVSLYGKAGMEGHAGNKVIVFNKSPEDLKRAPRTPRDFWNKFSGEEHKSAMMGTEGRLEKLRDDVTKQQTKLMDDVRKSIEKIQSVGLFAALALVVGILSVLLSALLPRYLDTERAYMESAQKLQTLALEVQELKKQAANVAPRPGVQQPTAPPQQVK